MKTLNESHPFALPLSHSARPDSLCNLDGRFVMKSNYDEYIGVKFGRLTVVRFAGYYQKGRQKRVKVYCECECGGNRTSILKDIKNGKTRSCGCLQKISHTITHGMSKMSEYRIYNNMLSRCYNKKVSSYKYYGARGITVCDRWLNSFENFYADMGARPSTKFSVDRIDNNGNYEPSNCRWATMKQQNENKRPSSPLTMIEHNGETLSIKKWAERYAINYHTFHNRIHRRGYSFEDAISKPVGRNIKLASWKK